MSVHSGNGDYWKREYIYTQMTFVTVSVHNFISVGLRACDWSQFSVVQQVT